MTRSELMNVRRADRLRGGGKCTQLEKNRDGDKWLKTVIERER